jgi:hypothetical protein
VISDSKISWTSFEKWIISFSQLVGLFDLISWSGFGFTYNLGGLFWSLSFVSTGNWFTFGLGRSYFRLAGLLSLSTSLRLKC